MDEKLNRVKGTSEKLITYVKDRPGHDLRYAIDSSKLQKELGWFPIQRRFGYALPAMDTTNPQNIKRVFFGLNSVSYAQRSKIKVGNPVLMDIIPGSPLPAARSMTLLDPHVPVAGVQRNLHGRVEYLEEKRPIWNHLVSRCTLSFHSQASLKSR